MNTLKNFQTRFASISELNCKILFDNNIRMKTEKLFGITMRKRERLRAIERLQNSTKQAFDYMNAIKSFLEKNK